MAMAEQRRVTRRNFLKTTGTGAAAMTAGAAVAPAVVAGKAPNSTIGVG